MITDLDFCRRFIQGSRVKEQQPARAACVTMACAVGLICRCAYDEQSPSIGADLNIVRGNRDRHGCDGPVRQIDTTDRTAALIRREDKAGFAGCLRQDRGRKRKESNDRTT